MSNNIKKAYFAGGCFWGVEYYFQKLNGVISTKVGYMGGHKNDPTYEEVCLGNTGHAEALEVEYDESKIDYEFLTKLFFEIHDPTQLNRQGPDFGSQYRSEVFYTDEKQKEIAEKLIQILSDKGFNIVTKLSKATTFWEAEKNHQQYYFKNGHMPYCHVKAKRF